MAKSTKSQTRSTATISHAQHWRDAKSALLLVSVLINIFFLVGWMVLKMTNVYDAALVTTLLGR